MNQPRGIGHMTIRNWWKQTFVGLQCSNKPWNWGQETGFGDHWQDQRDKSCEIIDVAIPECWKVSRSCEKISKNVGCKDKGDSGGNGGFRISTNEFEKQPEGYWRGNLWVNYPEMCTLEFRKNLKKGAQDVGERKENRLCSYASLGNLLLPGAREKNSLNIISCENFNNNYN